MSEDSALFDKGLPIRREVLGAEGNQVISNEVWAPDQLGRAVPAARFRASTERLLAENGYDLSLRDNPSGWWRR